MMGTDPSRVKLTKRPKARQFEAEWQTGPDKFVVLSVGHSASSRMLYASLRRERASDGSIGGLSSRIFAPFQDIAQIDRLRVARYSAKTAEAYFTEQVARVQAVLDGALDEKADAIMAIFAVPTTA